MLKRIEPIGYIKNIYVEKFGIPRQSNLVPSVLSKIEFVDKYKDENMLRDIEQFSHLWLIWGFSENDGEWAPTVRPPRLGGNKRVGVFATRSPFRPNSLGLTCVELKEVQNAEKGKILVVAGADLKNDTPIYDIKPYIPYVDSVPDAKGGFTEDAKNHILSVEFLDSVSCELTETEKAQLTEILSLDPRPAYQDDDSRIYGISYKNMQIKFTCNGKTILVEGLER